jgi:hypothetical protein
MLFSFWLFSPSALNDAISMPETPKAIKTASYARLPGMNAGLVNYLTRRWRQGLAAVVESLTAYRRATGRI